MRYLSTRGQSGLQDFRTVVLSGLAKDGGLFLPESLPDFSGRLEAWRSLPFAEVFQHVVAPFVAGELEPSELRDLVTRAFRCFDDPQVTPVVRVGDLHLVELFHGPTLAFKDVALQFLGPLFEHLLRRSGRNMTVVGATSGDTGSAAIHALRGTRGVEVFILFPHGRVSPVQELQMTTVPDANIHAVAVRGSFDDAQDIVKGMFNDRTFNAAYHLGAVNSINWARVLAQIGYYFFAYFRVLEQRPGMRIGDLVQVAVPTGNFGHIYAGVLARRMGLPVSRLLLATNANSILHRFVQTGEYRRGAVSQTLSPSMDIQVASNFERYLYDLSGRDADRVQGWLDGLRTEGGFQVDAALQAQVRKDFASAAVDDEATVSTIREVHQRWGYLLDPHSAVGVRAALELPAPGIPTLCMATAHPAKFGEAMRRALGREPELPPALAGLDSLPTRVKVLPARLEAVQQYVRETLAQPIAQGVRA